MICSLLALVLIPSAVIDYETVAKPLPAVLADLTSLTGAEMRASKAVESDMLVIRVRGADISKLREKIAEAIAGKWTEKEGVFTIQRDVSAEKQRYEGVLKERAGQIRNRSKTARSSALVLRN